MSAVSLRSLFQDALLRMGRASFYKRRKILISSLRAAAWEVPELGLIAKELEDTWK